MALPEMENAGNRIRAARRARGMSLRVLAEKVGVSASMLSLLENGKSRSSVRTLYAVVEALDMTMDELFSDQESPAAPPPPAERATEAAPSFITVARAGDRRRIEMETGVIWERLGRNSAAGLELMLVIYPPGARSSEFGRYHRHPGVESMFVVQGELTCRVGFEEVSLGVGDSVTFDCSQPHLLENRGVEEMRAVWVVLNRSADALESRTDGPVPPYSPGRAAGGSGHWPDQMR
ncbi:helix-turn-helix domain-containing protein [Acrocarpospora pleiomorpha]|nr:XRE family transcriptional regulator [Acrocarpospora pleiomorpha]